MKQINEKQSLIEKIMIKKEQEIEYYNLKHRAELELKNIEIEENMNQYKS